MKRNKWLILFIMISLFMMNQVSFKAQATSLTLCESIVVQSEYKLGDKLTLPETYESSKLEYFLLTPSNVTIHSNRATLDEVGKYHLIIKSKTETAQKEFMVYQNLAELTSKESLVSMTKDGLAVSLVDGDTLKLNQIVDLSSVTPEDEIFTLHITPSEKGAADFTILNIKFTDVEDSHSYLKYTLQSSPTNPYASYALAGATNQPMTGFESELGRLHRNNQWGAYFPLSFYGLDASNSTASVRFNSETNEAYSNPKYRIIDLDDPDFFANKWNGFTSGKVKIEISCSGYLTSSARFTIESIQNKVVDSLYAEDIAGPNITVDVNPNSIPTGVVGKSFPFFSATSSDEIDGKCGVDVKVYQNYGKTNQYDVNKNLNDFIPQEAGIYYLVYTSCDKSGNNSKKVYPVEIKPTQSKINLSILASTKTEKGNLGVPVELAKVIATGGSGEKNLSIQVKFNGKSLPIENNSFLPVEQGNYEIIYQATDYLGSSAMVMYNFEGIASDELIIEDEVYLPRYFIQGKMYSFESLVAFDYSKGYKEELTSKVAVIQNGITTFANPTCKIDTNQKSVTVLYDFGKKQIKKEIPVIDVGNQNEMDLTKYFVTSCSQIEAMDNGIKFTTNKDESISFIRDLLASDTTIKFQVLDGTNLEEVSLIYTDVLNQAKKVIFTFKKNKDETIFLINGKPLYYLTDCGFTQESKTNDFYLGLTKDFVNPFGNIQLQINTFSDGSLFTGFSQNYVQLDINLVTKEESTILIRNISGQPFSSTNKDRTKPMISLPSDFSSEAGMNEEVTLQKAYALDVLDPNYSFTLTVTDPVGNIVKTTDGILLDSVTPKEYKFLIDHYGTYLVTYMAQDTNNGLKQTITNSLLCEDKVAPTVDFVLSGKTKVNSKITIKDITVSDNETTELVPLVYTLCPNGEMVYCEKDYYSFVPKQAGTYRVVCSCYDEAGNMGVKWITIEVTK